VSDDRWCRHTAVKDGARRARGSQYRRATGPTRIDTPPFEDYCGELRPHLHLGGLKITNAGEVESTDAATIPGLFAAVEVGGCSSTTTPAERACVGAVSANWRADQTGVMFRGRISFAERGVPARSCFMRRAGRPTLR